MLLLLLMLLLVQLVVTFCCCPWALLLLLVLLTAVGSLCCWFCLMLQWWFFTSQSKFGCKLPRWIVRYSGKIIKSVAVVLMYIEHIRMMKVLWIFWNRNCTFFPNIKMYWSNSINKLLIRELIYSGIQPG